MPQIRPITDLRKTTEMSEICHAKKEPVFITKNGYGDLVLMSVETYDEMIGIAGVDRAISEAFECGRADTAFPELFALLTQKLTDLSSRQLVS